jgi:hypothetical protein
LVSEDEKLLRGVQIGRAAERKVVFFRDQDITTEQHAGQMERVTIAGDRPYFDRT